MEELHEESSENEDEMIEEKPSGIIQPKYKLVYSFPIDVGDSWEGYTTSQMDHEKMMKSRIVSIGLTRKMIGLAIGQTRLDISV